MQKPGRSSRLRYQQNRFLGSFHRPCRKTAVAAAAVAGFLPGRRWSAGSGCHDHAPRMTWVLSKPAGLQEPQWLCRGIQGLPIFHTVASMPFTWPLSCRFRRRASAPAPRTYGRMQRSSLELRLCRDSSRNTPNPCREVQIPVSAQFIEDCLQISLKVVYEQTWPPIAPATPVH